MCDPATGREDRRIDSFNVPLGLGLGLGLARVAVIPGVSDTCADPATGREDQRIYSLNVPF